jgi:calcium-dependent protein kinase
MTSEMNKSANQLMVPNQNGSTQGLAEYLILSNCTINKKILSYKQSQAFGMILSNSIGNTYLFFP